MLLVEGISRELASECSDARQNAHVRRRRECLPPWPLAAVGCCVHVDDPADRDAQHSVIAAIFASGTSGSK